MMQVSNGQESTRLKNGIQTKANNIQRTERQTDITKFEDKYCKAK